MSVETRTFFELTFWRFGLFSRPLFGLTFSILSDCCQFFELTNSQISAEPKKCQLTIAQISADGQLKIRDLTADRQLTPDLYWHCRHRSQLKFLSPRNDIFFVRSRTLSTDLLCQLTGFTLSGNKNFPRGSIPTPALKPSRLTTRPLVHLPSPAYTRYLNSLCSWETLQTM